MKLVAALAALTAGALLAAGAGCGADNALVGGECAPGYVLVGEACVPAGDVNGDGGGQGDSGDADGSRIDASRDGATGDGATGDGGTGDGAVGDGGAGDGAVTDADGGGGCPQGQIVCNAVCVDPMTDPFNCGGCGNVCQSLLCSAGKCQGSVAGHAVVIGHDFAGAYSAAQAKVLGNAATLPPGNTIQVRSYEQYAAPNAVNAVKSVITAAAQAQNRTVTYTTASQPSDVSSAMTNQNTDVLVVYDQSKAPASTLAGIGAGWASALATFEQSGGVVIVLDGQGGQDPQMPALIKSAQILDVSSDTVVQSGTPLLVAAPQDAVGLGVLSPYGAGKHTVHFACNEPNANMVTYVVEDPSGDAGASQPVVVHKVVP